jgi:hypothetical protein
MRGGRLEGPTIVSRFPVAFRLPAFAFSDILYPLGTWAPLSVGLPSGDGPQRAYHVPQWSEMRLMEVPSLLRGLRVPGAGPWEGRVPSSPNFPGAVHLSRVILNAASIEGSLSLTMSAFP